MKSHFPFFKNNQDIVFLDSAASSQIHENVLNKINSVYENNYANIHRGLYKQSEKTSLQYDESRKLVAEYINAETNEIVWTTGTTDGLNLLANHYYETLDKGDIILLSKMEHHANLVPWQRLLSKGIILEFINVSDGVLDIKDFKEKISKKVKVISICHASNVTGVINPIKFIIQESKKYNIDVIIDAAQTFSHINIDVKEINCDYLVFSAHKAYGPNGVGCLYAKKEKLKNLTLYRVGGDTIDTVTYKKTLFLDPPQCFEAGTPNISGIIAFSESIKFLKKHRDELNNAELLIPLVTFLKENNFHIIAENIYRVPIISTYHDTINSFDLAYYLSIKNVCCRIGDHCAMPFIKENLKISGTIRFSLGIYNDKNDIDKTIEVIKKYLKRSN
jgi:cysteine desulfurase/selenocysteine lyase